MMKQRVVTSVGGSVGGWVGECHVGWLSGGFGG